MTPIGIELGPRFLRTAVFARDHGPRFISPPYAGRWDLLARVAIRGGSAMVLPASASAVTAIGLEAGGGNDHAARTFACVCLLRRAIRDARCEGAEGTTRIAISRHLDDSSMSPLIESAFDLLGLAKPLEVDPRVAALAAIERPASGAWIVIASHHDETHVGMVHVDRDGLRLVSARTLTESAWSAARQAVLHAMPNGEGQASLAIDALCEEALASTQSGCKQLRRFCLHARQVIDVGITATQLCEVLRGPTRALAHALADLEKEARSMGIPLVGIRESGDTTVPRVLADAVALAELDPSLVDRSPPTSRYAHAFGLAVLASGRLRCIATAPFSPRSTREVVALSRGRSNELVETVVIPAGAALPASAQLVKYARPGQRILDLVFKRAGRGAEPEMLHRQLDLSSLHDSIAEFTVRLTLDELEQLKVEATLPGSGLAVPLARPLLTIDRMSIDPITIPLAD